jgi:hypothetical protein
LKFGRIAFWKCVYEKRFSGGGTDHTDFTDATDSISARSSSASPMTFARAEMLTLRAGEIRPIALIRKIRFPNRKTPFLISRPNNAVFASNTAVATIAPTPIAR